MCEPGPLAASAATMPPNGLARVREEGASAVRCTGPEKLPQRLRKRRASLSSIGARTGPRNLGATFDACMPFGFAAHRCQPATGRRVSFLECVKPDEQAAKCGPLLEPRKQRDCQRRAARQ